jgi:hypothetical protein
VLRRVFGTEEEEVAGGRRKFHNELLNLHVMLDKIGKIKDSEVPGGGGWYGYVTCLG